MEMIFCNTIMAFERKSSCGAIVLDHLAADGAGFTACQVTVVAVGQVNAHFLSSLHLETVHSFPCLGNIDLVVVLHNLFSPSFLPRSQTGAFFLGLCSELFGGFSAANIALPK